MALTATATPLYASYFHEHNHTRLVPDIVTSVQEDIMSSLKMCTDHLFKVVHPFNRANLLYEVHA